MIAITQSFLSLLLTGLLVSSVVSCGKKQIETGEENGQQQNPQISEIEVMLNKQELLCSDDRGCPRFLTKVAVVVDDKLRFCTGFLTDKNIVATATSCLPEYLRMGGQNCSKVAYFFFQQGNEKPLRVGCKEVLKSSSIEGKYDFLWRSNVTYLMLSEDLDDRRLPVIARQQGMKDAEKLYMWSVDQIDDHQAIIRKSEDCISAHKTYFNPLSTSDSSPVVTMGGCEFNDGNSGSPVFDYRNRIRGMVSRSVSKEAINDAVSLRLLERPLVPLIHVSNFACAPMIPEQEVMDETECSKKLTINLHDTARQEMISDNIFRPMALKLEQLVTAESLYLNFGVRLENLGDYYQTEVYPKCFKNINSWIGEFTNSKPVTNTIDVPEMIFRKSMDQFGRVRALEFSKGKNTTFFQFNPKFLRTGSPRKTTVFVWADGPTTTYRDVSEICPASLF